MDNEYGSGQIEFSVSSEKIIMTNRKVRKKVSEELGLTGKHIGRMLNANYIPLINNGVAFLLNRLK